MEISSHAREAAKQIMGSPRRLNITEEIIQTAVNDALDEQNKAGMYSTDEATDTPDPADDLTGDVFIEDPDSDDS